MTARVWGTRMTPLAKITMTFVVFIDIIGQGLVFPIINALIMESSSTFLPADTAQSARHFYYGLVIGSFFLAWFLGVVYIARVSDAIGRKNALLVCLGGALVGYAITIVALYLDSLALLILGRVVTGFTAGNQPIAQAAIIDGSTDDADRDRNFGYIVAGLSLGLVGGPILGAALTDKALIGDAANFSLPFYAAFVMVVIAMVMVAVYFHDVKRTRETFVFRPYDVIDSLVRIKDHPLIMRLMPVYACVMAANSTFYIFNDNYLTSRFDYGVIGSSAAMLVIGISLAFSSTMLVKPMQSRFDKGQIVQVSLVVMVICGAVFIMVDWGPLAYIPIFFFYLLFGVAYPTLLGLFSGAATAADQGWAMGVTTAVFCLMGGVLSLLGGLLMSISIILPFLIVIAAALLALVVQFMTWNVPEIRKLTARPEQSAAVTR